MTEEEARIEQVAAAWRDRDRDGGVAWHFAWYDLPVAARVEAARRAASQRAMEAALDPEGLSTTGHAVMARIRART
jgi:hypothetical protein